MFDKVIVTNVRVLKQKYGAAGVKGIQSAVRDLIAADKKRGLSTSLLALDDPAAMKKLTAPSVKNAASTQENKQAIDGIYKALVPDYLMILGAIDVVPHQDLKNPLFSTDPDGDDDEFAYSDVPYACEAPYSQNVQDFTGPTRVVSRLPDLTGAQGSPKYLIRALKTATSWKSSPRSEYQTYLGISAEKWRDSTAESLTNIFSSAKDLQTSPRKGYKWKPDLINRRVHFINCHGGDTYPDFLGQSSTDDDDMPTSHQASFVAQKGQIVEGTVMAAECCYGGQLYDPSAADNGQMGMSNIYLDQGAYGFFGSTTTAYGPFKGNDQADLICQYFLQRVLAGASLGRAVLEARQRFVERASPLSPMNQKTLAQFNLYGDPAIVPVDTPTSKLVIEPTIISSAKSVKFGSAKKPGRVTKAAQEGRAVERADRRATLRAKGMLLAQLQPPMRRSDAATPNKVHSSMKKMMDQLNLRPLSSISFTVQPATTDSLIPRSAMAKGISRAVAAKKQETTAFHIMFGVSASSTAAKKGKGPGAGKKGMIKGIAAKAEVAKDDRRKNSPIRKFVVLEAKEVDGKIVAVTESHSK